MSRRGYNGTRFSIDDSVSRRMFLRDRVEVWRGTVTRVLAGGRVLVVEWSHDPGVSVRCHPSTVSYVARGEA